MKKILIVAAVVGLGWYGNNRFQQHPQEQRFGADPSDFAVTETSGSSTTAFHCDGRTRCSAMTSCEEASYFIKNCPNTEMDGDNDGVPCEQQWCN